MDAGKDPRMAPMLTPRAVCRQLWPLLWWSFRQRSWKAKLFQISLCWLPVRRTDHCGLLHFVKFSREGCWILHRWLPAQNVGLRRYFLYLLCIDTPSWPANNKYSKNPEITVIQAHWQTLLIPYIAIKDYIHLTDSKQSQW